MEHNYSLAFESDYLRMEVDVEQLNLSSVISVTFPRCDMEFDEDCWLWENEISPSDVARFTPENLARLFTNLEKVIEEDQAAFDAYISRFSEDERENAAVDYDSKAEQKITDLVNGFIDGKAS